MFFWRFFLVIVLILGIFFRFTHLGDKIYWYDEAMTSLRASGYTEQEVVQHFYQKSVVSLTELQHYQHPDRTRSITDTLQSAAREDQKYSPIYYSLANSWFQNIGSSPTLARLLPALLSLLVFPSTYWFCEELFVKTGVFTSSLPVWIAITLMAISPFQVLYAQESRYYSLWTVTTLLSSAALLRGIRLNTKISWSIYAFIQAIYLNTSLLSLLVTASYSIYVLIISRFRLSKILPGYLGAFLVSAIAFLPWAGIVITNLSQAEEGINWSFIYSLEHSELRDIWLQHLGRIFFAINQPTWDLSVSILLLFLVVYAFYCLCWQTPISVWLLLILMLTGSSLPLMLPDWIFGGMRSIETRYLIPSLLAIQMAMTYLLGKNLTNSLLKFWTYLWWRLCFIILISGSIVSCVISSQSEVWYNKGHDNENIVVAKIINQANSPLLLSDTGTGHLLSLSHSLKPTVQILLRPSCSTCQISDAGGIRLNLSKLEGLGKFSDIFLYHYNPSDSWLKQLGKQHNYRFERLVFGFAEWSKDRPVLWRIIPMQKQ